MAVPPTKSYHLEWLEFAQAQIRSYSHKLNMRGTKRKSAATFKRGTVHSRVQLPGHRGPRRRSGRSLKHLVTAIAELDGLGVTFVILKDHWDLSTPSGRLMFQIEGAMAEFERSLIAERIRAGMRRRTLEGLSLGWSPIRADHARLVADRLSGMPLTQVTRRYPVSRASVVRWVREAQRKSADAIPPPPWFPKLPVRSPTAASSRASRWSGRSSPRSDCPGAPRRLGTAITNVRCAW